MCVINSGSLTNATSVFSSSFCLCPSIASPFFPVLRCAPSCNWVIFSSLERCLRQAAVSRWPPAYCLGLCVFVSLAREHNHCLSSIVMVQLWYWHIISDPGYLASWNVSEEAGRYGSECGDVILQSTLPFLMSLSFRALTLSDCGLFSLSVSLLKTAEGGRGFCWDLDILPSPFSSLKLDA